MSKSSAKLKINKLVLEGRDKNYVVEFHNGLNIIYGDSDTGKSSILNLVNYLLGSKNVYMYEELEIHGKEALLEVLLNDEIFTIKRNIFNSNDFIEVYPSSIENIKDTFPLEFGPDYKKMGPNGFFSDFLLESLNIPLIEVKVAPTKADSKTIRLSFRDIFKFCYLNQDDVGSKDMLDRKNFSVFTKNKETFKFIHNVLDTQVLDMEKDLSEKRRKKNELIAEYKIVSTFLRDARFETEDSINHKIEQTNLELIFIESNISKINSTLLSDTEQFEDLRQDIFLLEKQINETHVEKSVKETQLEQNIRLRKEYKKDIDKLNASIEIKEALPENDEEPNLSCPLCDSIIILDSKENTIIQYEGRMLENEIKKLKSRINDIDGLIIEQRNGVYIFEENLRKWKNELAEKKNTLDMNTKQIISPYLSQRDEMMSKRAALHETKQSILYLHKVRTKLNKLNQNAEIIQEQISELDGKLEKLKKGTPEIEQVIGDIADILSEYLHTIPILNAHGISINKNTFLPVVRNRDYHNLTSGGLRTIVSIGYFISLLKYGDKYNTYLPSILMIDTLGKYLGTNDTIPKKDRIREIVDDEGLKDPEKYSNLYKYLVSIHETLFETHQIIVVDNQLPSGLETTLSKYVVKHFSVDGIGDSKGLIDNA
ncbi:hypothetical protein FQP34_22335 [Peribacillus simplex]|uniref:Exonuclease SbcC n=1 Tax=Peribacillus simplex TaxID=1478 RepID=A0A8B5XSY8_9BACI|nr:hypothetical protein [Peribacillus simplex]TVX77164.1 hypothetical protein FQP34_22335 [Peribacillus simplex]